MDELTLQFIGCIAGNQSDIDAIKLLAIDSTDEKMQKRAIAFLEFCKEMHTLFGAPAPPILRKHRA